MSMPESRGNATPTEDERETAWRLLHSGGLDSFRAEVIAQHLADQRAKYEAVADDTDAVVNQLVATGEYWRGHIDGMRHVSRRIRSVLL